MSHCWSSAWLGKMLTNLKTNKAKTEQKKYCAFLLPLQVISVMEKVGLWLSYTFLGQELVAVACMRWREEVPLSPSALPTNPTGHGKRCWFISSRNSQCQGGVLKLWYKPWALQVRISSKTTFLVYVCGLSPGYREDKGKEFCLGQDTEPRSSAGCCGELLTPNPSLRKQESNQTS